jgi:hypothetical protein
MARNLLVRQPLRRQRLGELLAIHALVRNSQPQTTMNTMNLRPGSTRRNLPVPHPRWFIGFVFSLLGASCAPPSVPKPAAASGNETRPAEAGVANASAPDLAAHMQASFWEAIRARDALIGGDLPAAQRAADALANQDFRQLIPADWQHWVNAMQQSARELSMAPNLASASANIGHIAITCGECHEVHRRGPGPVTAQPEAWRDPPDELNARMVRHQIGADQMWDGLVTPSEEAFRSGTITLTRAPLTPPERNGEPIAPELHDRIELIRALARQAREATTYAERGRVYGELIARCADCHYYIRPAQ